MKINKKILTVYSILSFLLMASKVNAAGNLIVYCSAEKLCEAQVQAFSEKYDVKVTSIYNATGSTLARIEAEKKKPQGDVWYGGTMEFHSQAGEIGLLSPYQSPQLEFIFEHLRDPAKRKGNYSSAIYMGLLGFGVNTKRLAEKGLDIPLCWSDLLKPEYKNEIQIADIKNSGTAYTTLATLIQLWGEDEAFNYLKALNKNIEQYTKSGSTPARSTALGSVAIGIGFLHSYSYQKSLGAPLTLISPCEGTSYEIGGVSIIKGSHNLENAQLFVDWVLSKEGQELAWKKGQSLQILTNNTATQSPNALDPNEFKLIKYDMDKYGSSSERKRLIKKFDDVIKKDEL